MRSEPELVIEPHGPVVAMEAIGDAVLVAKVPEEEAKDLVRAGALIVLHAVALSFATLGPRAHSALAEVEGLINVERPRPIRSSDGRVWDLALARMGKPIDEFNWPGHKPEYVARERESLRRQVEHFDPKRVWTY